MKKTLIACAVLAYTAVSFSDTATAAVVPSLGEGWVTHTIEISELTPLYDLTLFDSAVFSITDAFFFDDTFSVFNHGSLILTTAVNFGAPFPPSDEMADLNWESGWYSIGSVILPAGDHKISIQGDGAGGLPSTFYTRIDRRVPELGSTAVMLGVALAGMGAVGRKLK